MSTERLILQKLYESRRIKNSERLNESWPPVLNSLTPYLKKTVRSELIKAGIDIENTPYKEVVITRGKDPRLSGKNMVVFQFADRAHGIAVWFNGKVLVDYHDFSTGKDFSKMSWKQILNSTDKVIVLEFDQATSDAMIAKKKARQESQDGMVKRYTPGELKKMDYTKARRLHLDKSGYEMNPRKYVDMFAAMNLENADKILATAKDIYVKLAAKLDASMFDMPGSTFESYEYLLRNIPGTFRDLSKSLDKYNARKNDPRAGNGWINWEADNVKANIKELKELINKAKKFI